MASNFKPSATLLAKDIKLKRLERSLPVYDGGLGESPMPTPNILSDTVKEFCHLKEYTDVAGVSELRSALEKVYYPSQKSSMERRLVIGNGLKPLLYLVQLSFSKLFSSNSLPYVIVHLAPAWTSYIEQINIILGYELSEHFDQGHPNYILVQPDYSMSHSDSTASSSVIPWAKVTPYQFEQQLDKHLEKYQFDRKEASILVIMNNPNNPSGCIYNKYELEQFAKVFNKYNKLVCFADDIYGGLVYKSFFEDENHFGGSIAQYYAHGTIQGSSLSKNWGCGGYRFGWLIFPEKNNERVNECQILVDILYKTCVSLASSLYSCPSQMLQYAGAKALNSSESVLFPGSPESEKELNEIALMLIFQRRMFETIGQYCKERCRNMGLSHSDAKGAWYMLIDFEQTYGAKLISRNIRTSSELCQVLCNEIGFITVSCENFGILPSQKNFLLRYSFVDIKDIEISKLPGFNAERIHNGFDALESWLKNFKL